MYDPGKALLLLALDGFLKEADDPTAWVAQREKELTTGGRKLYPNFLTNAVPLGPPEMADLQAFLGKQAPERMRASLAKNFYNAATTGRGDLVPGAYRPLFHSWLQGKGQVQALSPELQTQEDAGQKSVRDSQQEALLQADENARSNPQPALSNSAHPYLNLLNPVRAAKGLFNEGVRTYAPAAKGLYGYGESLLRDTYDKAKDKISDEFADTQRKANEEREKSIARATVEGANQAMAKADPWLAQKTQEARTAAGGALTDALAKVEAEAPAIGAAAGSAAGGAATQGALDKGQELFTQLINSLSGQATQAWNDPGKAVGQVWGQVQAHPLISALAAALGLGGTYMLGKSLFGGGSGGGGGSGYDQGYADAMRERQHKGFRSGYYGS